MVISCSSTSAAQSMSHQLTSSTWHLIHHMGWCTHCACCTPSGAFFDTHHAHHCMVYHSFATCPNQCDLFNVDCCRMTADCHFGAGRQPSVCVVAMPIMAISSISKTSILFLWNIQELQVWSSCINEDLRRDSWFSRITSQPSGFDSLVIFESKCFKQWKKSCNSYLDWVKRPRNCQHWL